MPVKTLPMIFRELFPQIKIAKYYHTRNLKNHSRFLRVIDEKGLQYLFVYKGENAWNLMRTNSREWEKAL